MTARNKLFQVLSLMSTGMGHFVRPASSLQKKQESKAPVSGFGLVCDNSLAAVGRKRKGRKEDPKTKSRRKMAKASRRKNRRK